jgi:hypothetical protein
MSTKVRVSENSVAPRSRRRLHRTVFHCGAAILLAWLFTAYLVLPLGWRHYERRHPALDGDSWITHTGNNIPGDPLNIALVGTEKELQLAMLSAKWFPADPITLRSSLRIAAGTVLDRAYTDAPVSSLYFFGRKQDLAFEQPIGSNPWRRHHVRFWKCDEVDESGRPLWIGSATLDIRVGLSYTTGQITHHISSAIDPQRDKIIDDLTAAGDLLEAYWVDDFQEPPQGRNGGGDPWRTDGRLAVGVLKEQN